MKLKINGSKRNTDKNKIRKRETEVKRKLR